jgi:uncharacterized protein (DUF2267 family)
MTARESALRLFSAAALLLAPVLHAQTGESNATAQRLMVRSGLAVQLRGVTDQIVNDIRQNAGSIDSSTADRLVEAARQAFRPEALQQDITARVARKLTVDDMNVALAWLDTYAGARITHAEEVASGSMDITRLAEYAHRLQTKPLPAERQKIISDLISATGAVRVAAAVAETMALGIALGMDSLQPQERRVGEARLRAHIRRSMPADKAQAVYAQQLPVSYAYTYREISDADLAAYVGFLRGATGKRYQEGMNAAFMEGLARASLRMGEFAPTRQRRTSL